MACTKQIWSWSTSTSKVINHARHGKGSTSNYSSLRRSTITMMPEGPEVRTVVTKLQPAKGMRLLDIKFISGRYVTNQRPVGFHEFSKTMSSSFQNYIDYTNYDKVDLIQEWNCKGKFIWIVLDDGDGNGDGDDGDYSRSMWITLGMSGRFYNENEIDKKSKSLRWYLELWDYTSNKIRRIYYVDTRNFGTLKFSLSKSELLHKVHTKLGPDMLNDDTTEDIFLDCLTSYKARSSPNVCKLLMNQKVVSGIGNYILSEGLYKSNIDPFASLNELDQNQRKLLFHALRSTSVQSYSSKMKNDDEFELECYGRKVSLSGKEVIREVDGPHGRAIWYVEDQLFMPREERLTVKDKENEVVLTETSEVSNTMDPKDLKPYLNEGSWRNALNDVLSSETFTTITEYLDTERAQGHAIYPPEKDIFSALNLCPLENVKVVIVGQDPYHGTNQAHGLAFSVQKHIPIPPSLRNIFLEISNNDNIGASTDTRATIPNHGNLEYWAKQGVLLLNTVLTVRKGQANSHSKIGWEHFTSEVLNILNTEKEGLVFLCWGNAAIKKVTSVVDENKHFVITTSHPSPLGATKTSSPFLGSRCFSRCNEFLDENGLDPIDWRIA